VIGIGSNSLRLLVTDIGNATQTAVLRERIGLRVFSSLDQRLDINEDMIHNACEAVALMKHSAEKLGAQTVHLFATSAVRDAKNKAAFTNELLKKTGLTLFILSGELEAKLSFLGAAGEGSAGMIDIGGGSTEIVIGDGGHILFSCSLQAGAVRLFREIHLGSVTDVQQIMNAVNTLLAAQLSKIRQMKIPTDWVGIGGTMTSAASCIQDVDWDSDNEIFGFTVQRPEIRRVLESLAAMTPDRRRDLRSIPPDRADIVVHGFAILLACMETLAIDEIKVSEHTNLDGYLMMITAGE
jgi:exopolyphosphatase/guanosine-5'-triphosphate,3'-diphosphate pyrophosphatase